MKNCFNCEHFTQKSECAYADMRHDRNEFAGLASTGFRRRFAGKCNLGYNIIDYKVEKGKITDEVLDYGVTPISAAIDDCCDDWDGKLNDRQNQAVMQLVKDYDDATHGYIIGNRNIEAEDRFEKWNRDEPIDVTEVLNRFYNGGINHD